jgi:hypothetical protein
MPRTILTNPTSLGIVSSDHELPVLLLDATRPIPNSVFTNVTPVYTDSSDEDGDSFDAANFGLSFWESVEGMLVKVPDMVLADGVVGTSGGDPFVQAYSQVHANLEQINERGGYTIGGNTPTVEGGQHLHDGDPRHDGRLPGRRHRHRRLRLHRPQIVRHRLQSGRIREQDAGAGPDPARQ